MIVKFFWLLLIPAWAVFIAVHSQMTAHHYLRGV